MFIIRNTLQRMSKYAPYFEAISEEQIQCKICNQKMTKVSSTTSIKRHMERLHPVEYQQMNADAESNGAKKRKLNPLAGARRSPVSDYLAQFLQEEQAKNPKDRMNQRFNPTLSLIPNDDLQQQLDIFSEVACSSIKVEPETEVFFDGISAESLFKNDDFKAETKINEGRMSIAIVQAGTVLYDTAKTIDKLERFVEEAAGKGSKLVLFPEGFVGGYPKWNDFGIVLGTRSPEGREEYKKYFNSSIHENGPESERLAELAAKHQIHLVVGVIERDGDTLYCSVFFYSPEKYLGKHRKLMPTAMERCVWGCGDGSTMPVFETELGKIGAAICWENYMPLYRVNLYAKGIQLYLAPTVDDREVWLSTMRTIALEGRCFVISACQFLRAGDFPEEHPLRKQHGEEKILIRGGSCAVDPLGTVLVEPDFSGEMIRYVDADLSVITKGKFDLDCIGHYARPDVFQLHVNEQPQRGIVRK